MCRQTHSLAADRDAEVKQDFGITFQVTEFVSREFGFTGCCCGDLHHHFVGLCPAHDPIGETFGLFLRGSYLKVRLLVCHDLTPFLQSRVRPAARCFARFHLEVCSLPEHARRGTIAPAGWR